MTPLEDDWVTLGLNIRCTDVSRPAMRRENVVDPEKIKGVRLPVPHGPGSAYIPTPMEFDNDY